MNPERRQQIEEILVAAVEVAPARREAFCERACGGDREMRAELERLLEGHDRAEKLGFLDAAAWRLESSRQTPEAEMIGKTIGQYEIQKKIGEQAGMGDVYLAVEKSRGEVIRKVVVKFAQERLGPNERKRFDDEVRILAALEHNHIARMYNFGVFEELPYFVMEHLDGVSLYQFLREEGKGGGLPLNVAVEIMKQACAGLQFAHDKGVVHRDIKPQNIMVMRPGGQLQVKVIDFGIAKASFGGTRKATSGPIGTPNYLSPEQIAPDRFGLVDQRADVYAMGLVAHEMLTGKMAVRGAEVFELLEKQLNETPPPPGVHEEVDAVVMKAVKKKQGERQKSIAEFAADFDRAVRIVTESKTLVDEKTVDPVPPAPSPKWIWAMAAVLALVVAAGLAKTYWPAADSGNPVVIAPAPSPPVAVTATPTPNIPAERPPAAREESPKITLFQLRNGKLQTVPSDTVFRGGDKLRFTVESPQDAFLYLLQQGSSGRFSVLIPDQRIRGGRHRVKSGEAFAYPPSGGSFELEGTPGDETIYIFTAAEKSDPLAAAIERSIAGKIRDARGQALLDEETARMLTAAASEKPARAQVLKLTHK